MSQRGAFTVGGIMRENVRGNYVGYFHGLNSVSQNPYTEALFPSVAAFRLTAPTEVIKAI